MNATSAETPVWYKNAASLFETQNSRAGLRIILQLSESIPLPIPTLQTTCSIMRFASLVILSVAAIISTALATPVPLEEDLKYGALTSRATDDVSGKRASGKRASGKFQL